MKKRKAEKDFTRSIEMKKYNCKNFLLLQKQVFTNQ